MSLSTCKTETFARLRISSCKLTPQEISERLNIQPSQTTLLGEFRGKSKLVEKDNVWELSSTLHPEQEIELHIQNILNAVNPVSETISRLVENKQAKVELLCAIYSEVIPSLYLNSKTVLGIAKLKANLDFDVMLVSKD